MDKTKQQKYINILIEQTERELVNCEVQCWVYQREYDNPQNIGKEKAKESLDIYLKQCGFLKIRIEIYKEYLKQL